MIPNCMELYFYQAECGDAARIRYIGTDGKPHNIFIDAGYERTYDHVLAGEIQTIRHAGELIDLWIVSHIHDDHIGGVLEYTNSLLYGSEKDIVENWYYNLPHSSVQASDVSFSGLISSIKSISQADDLTNYLLKKKKLLGVDITTTMPLQDFFGLKIIVLSPTPSKLERLRKKYPATERKTLEQNEISSISEAKAAKAYDYHTSIESFNLSQWKEDNSVENGSSISVLTEFEGKKVLWLADSHPTDIVDSLQKLGYSKLNPLVCEYVKVCHHGSKGNNSDALYELIRCDNYVMSVNGENQHFLPNKECIARILRNQNRPESSLYCFHFTYDNQTLRNIFKVDGEEVYEKYRFAAFFSNNQKWIHIQN